jgi:D-alanine-D-alanine ligase
MTRAKTSRRVAVLGGGFSKEREVSLVSGAAAAKALRARGYDVAEIDPPRDMGALVAELNKAKPDVVFNALHGRFGEDGCIQGLLDMMGLPYTHSGRMASAIAMDKPMAKKMFASVNIPVAAEKIVTVREAARGDVMPRPYVLKPTNEGSSVGVKLVRDGSNRPPLDDLGLGDDDLIMAEQFIPGREVTVAVLGDRALAVTEITTTHTFYDYDAKYAAGGSTHILPAPLTATQTKHVMDLAVRAHNVLGCRGASRSDFRLDGDTFYILEVNTQPGMTPTSLVPEQAAHVGMSFEDLVTWMVEEARCDA